MRSLAFFLAAMVLCATARGAVGDDKIRLAQSGERHRLHDAMQFAGGNLPNDLSRTRHADDDRAERHHQCDGKHDVSVELQFAVQVTCQTTCARQSPSQ